MLWEHYRNYMLVRNFVPCFESRMTEVEEQVDEVDSEVVLCLASRGAPAVLALFPSWCWAASELHFLHACSQRCDCHVCRALLARAHE